MSRKTESFDNRRKPAESLSDWAILIATRNLFGAGHDSRFRRCSFLVFERDDGPSSCGNHSRRSARQEFAKPQDFYNVEISPNGQFIALRVPVDGDQTGIAVLSLSQLKILSKVTLGDHRSVSRYWWVGPNRLVVTPAIQYGTLEQPSGTGELFGFDADGSNQTYLYGYQGAQETGELIHGVTKTFGVAWIIKTLPDDPEHAIIETRSFDDNDDYGHDETYRLNNNNGFLDKRDASPAEGASYLLSDNKGALRFALVSRNFEDVLIYFRAIAGGEWSSMNVGDLQNSVIEPLKFSVDDSRVCLVSDDRAGHECLIEKDLKSDAQTSLACSH